MDKIEMQILGISSGHSATSYTLILEEVNGPRKLPIIIGAFEAQAIAIEIEKIVPARPMTHDLIKSFALNFHVNIQEVVIHRLSEGVFYANIVCSDGSITKEIDARTSDAIALALRFKCPIYTFEPIMAEAAIILADLEMERKPETIGTEKKEKSTSKSKTKSDLTQFSNEELEKMLEEALEEENYILAAKIRDEMKKRSGEED